MLLVGLGVQAQQGNPNTRINDAWSARSNPQMYDSKTGDQFWMTSTDSQPPPSSYVQVLEWIRKQSPDEGTSELPDDYETLDGKSYQPGGTSSSKICEKDRKALNNLFLSIANQAAIPHCKSQDGENFYPKTASDIYSALMGQTAQEIDKVLIDVGKARSEKVKKDPQYAKMLSQQGLKVDPRFSGNCMAGVKYAMCGDSSQANKIDDSRNRSRACSLDMVGKDGWPPGASALETMRFLKTKPQFWTDLSCGGCMPPAAAPDNSIICYEPIVSAKKFQETTGKRDKTAKYGHCEIKVRTPDGKTKYCYDGCGNLPRSGIPNWAANVAKNRKVAAVFVRAESGIKPNCAAFAAR